MKTLGLILLSLMIFDSVISQKSIEGTWMFDGDDQIYYIKKVKSGINFVNFKTKEEFFYNKTSPNTYTNSEWNWKMTVEKLGIIFESTITDHKYLLIRLSSSYVDPASPKVEYKGDIMILKAGEIYKVTRKKKNKSNGYKISITYLSLAEDYEVINVTELPKAREEEILTNKNLGIVKINGEFYRIK